MADDSPPSQASIRTAYDLASEAYARKFIGELDHKPFDRTLLRQFASLVGSQRPVLDIGCGPGHTTAHLAALGLHVVGIDLSPKMVETATKCFPHVPFAVGDLLALPGEASSVGGVLAFYCIVHLPPDRLVAALAEVFRVLCEQGVLLLAFHAGSEVVRAENFLDTGAALDFRFFEPSQVEKALKTVGFDPIDVHTRESYATEHPSRRCYLFAHKPRSMA